MPGRTIAIGDIHGCAVALETLLAKLSVAADDTLVFLGDICDRGPGTKECLDRIIEFARHCRVIFILGNHDEMMLAAIEREGPIDQWLAFGGAETLASYGGEIENIPAAHREFLERAVPYWETESEIFVHANLEPNVPLEQQSGEWLRWTKLTGFEQPHPSGKRVVCGHTSQKSGIPKTLDGWVCIDTRVYDIGGWLTAMDVATNHFVQANESGNYRRLTAAIKGSSE